MIINGIKITATHFAYDGCHKIYLLEKETEIKDAEEHGYEIKQIKSIKSTYQKSCSLKFIRTWNSLTSIVPQGLRWYPYAK